MKNRYMTIPLIAILSSGCVERPQLTSISQPIPVQYVSEADTVDLSGKQQLKSVDMIPSRWWQLLQSETINELVEKGLANSPTLEMAAAKLQSVESLHQAEHGELMLPTVDLSLSGNRSHTSGAEVGLVGAGSQLNLYKGVLELDYQVDLFEGNRNRLEVSAGSVAIERHQLQAAGVTLSAEIVVTAIEIGKLMEQIAAMESIIEDESAQLAVTEQQYRIGVIPKTDLLSQRASLAQTRTRMPELKLALSKAKHRLALLTGTTATEMGMLDIALDRMMLPQQVPMIVPSQLVQQRPDIRLAEARLLQSASAVGVATANRYPTLNLTASFGSTSNQIDELLDSGTAVWGIGAGLLYPLFHGDALKAREQSAVANYQQQAANYRQQVLTAFQQVADAIRALQLDSERLQLTNQADQLSSDTLALVQAQHRQGAVSYLTLLNAQRQLQQTKIQSIEARAKLYNDTVALIVALGGGDWQHKESNG